MSGDGDTPGVDPNALGEGGAPALRVQTDCHVWAIDPRTLAALCELDGKLIEAEAIVALETETRRGGSVRAGDIATVPLKGVLMPEMGGLLGLLFGGGGLPAFQSGLQEAASDPDVGVIVIDVDSPGGMVDFIPETAAAVRAARAKKPVVAVCNTQAASGAYWLASQADEVTVTPSGEAGSIGVYQLHRDMSGRHAQAGVVHTFVSAGKYKVEGNPYEPLGDEARERMQVEVDDFYRMFTADVARGRRVDRADVVRGYGEGRCLHAREAVSAGLADRVETLSEAVRRVGSAAGRAALDRRREDGPSAEQLLAPTTVDAELQTVTYDADERARLLTVLA